MLDEFQHVIDRDSQKILQTVSDWLKEFINETRIPIAMIGMPNCELILDANEQLKRRFSMRASLDPFGWDTSEHLQVRLARISCFAGRLGYWNFHFMPEPTAGISEEIIRL